MGWEEKQIAKPRKQKELFIELSVDEKIIVDLLNENETMNIDQINFKSAAQQ